MSQTKRNRDYSDLPELEFEPLPVEGSANSFGQVVELSSVRAARPRKKKRLGDMLIEAGFIDAAQLGNALAYQKVHGGRIGSILVRLGLLDEARLNSTLGKQLGIATAEVEDIDPDPAVLAMIPEAIVRRHELVPIGVAGQVLQVGMTDPHNMSAIDDLRFMTSKRVDVRLITESTFQRFVRTRYTTGALVEEIVRDHRLDNRFEDLNQRVDERLADDPQARHPSIARLVSYLLDRAVAERASDVHIEPYETFDRIRMRAETGRLTTALTPPRELHKPLLKRLAALSGAEAGRDGHFVVRHEGDRVHVRMTVMPTVFGTAGVLHLRRQEARLSELGALGMTRDVLETVKGALAEPGLILVAGPQGSGCTSTLHACINHLNDPERHIIAVEDPVEETVPGVNHVPLDRARGRDFADAVALAMRQDADMLVVGDIADGATADAVLSAASEGRLVVAGIHAHDGIEAIMRLRELASQPVLVASTLRLVLGQRLVRRVCPKCAVPVRPTSTDVRASRITAGQLQSANFRVGRGCKRCNDTGHSGYTGAFEAIATPRNVLHALRAAGPPEIEAALRDHRSGTLFGAVVAHVLAGETTFVELGRVVGRHA